MSDGRPPFTPSSVLAWLLAEDGVSRALFEQSPFSSVLYDTAGRILAVNRAFEALWGLTLAQLPPDYSVLSDAELERQGFLPLVRRAFAGESVVLPLVRYDVATLTGVPRVTWTQGHFFPVRDASGEVSAVVLVHVDLTQRMEAEHALTLQTERLQDQAAEMELQQEELAARAEDLRHANRELEVALDRVERARSQSAESERYLRGVLESIADPFVAVDAGWRYRYANGPALRFFRMAGHEDPLGSDMWALFPRLLGTPLERALRRSMAERVPATVEEFDAARGTWSEIHCYPLSDGGLAMVWRDVTERRRAEETMHFLAEASAVLSASLDYERTVESLARLLVPRLADWCAVDLLDEHDGLRRLATAHADPDKVRWALEIEQRYPTDLQAPTGVGNVLRTGRPELHPVITDELLVSSARDEEHLRLLRSVGFTGAMLVPLRTAERTIGVLSLIAAESGRRYTEADLALAERLAERAALAVSQARLFRDNVMTRQELETQARQLDEARAALEVINRELRRANEELHAKTELAEARQGELGTILESIHDAFFALDEEWRFTYVNHEAERVLFRERAELLGRSIWEEFPESVDSPFWHQYHRAIRERVTVSFEAYYPPLETWFEVRAYPSDRGLAVVFRDVTERREAQAERERLLAERDAEHRRLVTVLEQSPLGIGIAEAPSGRLLFVNEQLATLFGRTPTLTDALDRYSVEWRGFHPDGRPIASTEWPIARALAGEVVRDVALFAQDAGGQHRELSASAAPVRDGQGRIVAAVVILADVSEQRRAEAALERARAEAEEANRAKTDFLARMSHELRTPLNAIGGYAQLLELGVRGPMSDAQRVDIQRIQRSQRHLLSLINDVLNYAKLEVGRVQYDIEPVSVREVLADVEALVEPQLAAKGLTLRVDRPDPALVVDADAEKTRQILLNLLSNAIKFTPAGGEVRVAVRTTDDAIHIDVRDTGIGVPEDKLEQIFEPFVQLARSSTAGQEGTGLGLAISRDLARAMGGELTVESAPARGSTFTVTLPLSGPPRLPPLPSRPHG